MKKFFERLSSAERRFVIVVLVAVFVVLNFMFVWPLFDDWKKVKVRRATAQQRLKLYQAHIDEIPKYAEEVKIMEAESPAVPAEDQAVEFVRAIQSQAAQSGVTIVSTSPQPTRGATNEFFLEKAQAVSVQSDEGALVDFLYQLGAGNSLIRVRDLSLRPDPPRHQLTANLKLVASYQKKSPARPGPAPAAGSPAAKPATTTDKKS